jgi:hypothetical protein
VPIRPKDLAGNVTLIGSLSAWRGLNMLLAIGNDLEPPPDLWATLCAKEQTKPTVMLGMTPGVAARLPSACSFHALSRAMLEFADLAVDIDTETGTFSATYYKLVPTFDVHDRLFARFPISAGAYCKRGRCDFGACG